MSSMQPISRRFVILVPSLLLVLLCSIALSLVTGSSTVGFDDIIQAITTRDEGETAIDAIIWRIRLPRALLAAAVGGALSLGGLVFQARLRNPLAEPYILGIAGGAAVGAIAGMFAGLAMFPGVTLASFIGATLVMGIVLLLSRSRTVGRSESLLLAGVMMNAFCSACIMFLISVSESSQVHHILFWLMGDLSMAESEQLVLLLPLFVCFVLLFAMARPMNLLLTGEESAAALGLDVRRSTWLLLGTTTFMVSLVVSQAGLVGFVGLVVPHFFRLLLGSDHRVLVPACIFGGGAYLVLCDLLARSLPASGEMPVGVITAMIGAPLFVFMLWKVQK